MAVIAFSCDVCGKLYTLIWEEHIEEATIDSKEYKACNRKAVRTCDTCFDQEAVE